MRQRLTRYKRAFGLLEVLIAIAISSVVLIGAMVVATKSIRFVRANELQDMANGILIKSLEVSRSPIDFNLNASLGQSRGPKYFTLTEEAPAGGSEGRVDEQLVLKESNAAVGEISECGENSAFRVGILDLQEQELYADGDFEDQFVICNQIIVSEVSNDDVRRVFEVKSVVVYKLFDENVRSELISYRTEIVN